MAIVGFEYKNILEIPLTGTDLQSPSLPHESPRVVLHTHAKQRSAKPIFSRGLNQLFNNRNFQQSLLSTIITSTAVHIIFWMKNQTFFTRLLQLLNFSTPQL